MLKAFMSEVFWDTNPLSEAYVEKSMSYLDIMDVISAYSNKFEEKTTMSVAQWCTKAAFTLWMLRNAEREENQKTARNSCIAKCICSRKDFMVRSTLGDK